MDTRDILPHVLSSEDSISSTVMLVTEGEPVKKDLSAHIEDNLSRLFECLKLEYGRRLLVSPKWKNFGSQKLQLSEKTRLNNAIWRCWHIQYQKNKKPLFCQFVSPLSEEREPPKKQMAIILQGRYWRRKLDAIAREYKKWRTYYKQKSQEAELEAKQERLRSLSTSSGDDEKLHGSPLTQEVNLMDMQLTKDMVHMHPDTLFTTKTASKLKPKEKVPEASISEITFQPSLDSLQPNLDDFGSLVDFLTQNQPSVSYQVPFSTSSRENLPFRSNQLPVTTLESSLSSQTPIMMPFQGSQNNVEMMDHSQNFGLYSVPTGVGQETQSIQQVTSLPQGEDFMDTSDNFQQYPIEYNSQVNLQSFSPSSGQPLSHEGIPLEHLEEENEQELFVSQAEVTAVTSPQKSPLSVLPQSSVQQIPVSHLQDPKLMPSAQQQQQQQHLPYRHSSGNLQEYGTSPVRKGRLPRNVSDNQLSMNDSPQLGLGLSFFHSQEPKIPAQVQFPNLVAHLQSSNSSRSESLSTGVQAKRARIPRNMSDSGLYDMLRTSKSHLPTSYEGSLPQFNAAMATSPPHHASQQTPLEQIRAQALAAQAQPQILPSPFQPAQASQIKHSSGRSRKGKLPRNMSDSSLMYMSNQNMSLNVKGFPTRGRRSSDSLPTRSPPMSLPSAHPVLPLPNQGLDPLTSLQGSHPVYASTMVSSPTFDAAKQEALPSISSSAVGAIPHNQMLQFDQLQNQNQSSMASSSAPNTGLAKHVQSFDEPPKATSLLSQLLLQGENSPKPQKLTTAEPENQMVKQLIQVVQKQSQLASSKQVSGQELMLAALKSTSTNQQLTELLSLLQGTSPQQRSTDAVATTSSSQLYHILSQHEQQQQQQQQQQQGQKSMQFLQQQQQPFGQTSQQGNDKSPQPTAQVLEQQLQQQLLQEQQQLQQQAQENQKTSQLISALKSTTQVLQQQLAQPQQPLQQLLQQQTVGPQGAVFANNQTVSTRQSNVTIQPRPVSTITHKAHPGTVQITPHPKVSSSKIQGAQASQSTLLHPVQVVTAEVQPPASSLITLQDMLDESNSSKIVLPSGSKANSNHLGTTGLPQQSTAMNISSFSFPQAPFTTGTTTTAAATTNELTSIAGASNQTPKFTRPISAADRETYKEHRRQSHITAEQKRRCNIKVGFDQLLNLVPSLAHQKNSKISKATILQKSVEYTMKLQREREKMVEEEQLLRKEIQSLHSSISACQQQLPASGVPVNRQRSDQMLTMYNQFVKARTQENYKYWILGVIFRQVFEVYNQSVSPSTWEEFCANILSWLDEHCTLPNLRPAVLSALRDISRSTSILTNPSKFPEEVQHYVAANSDPTVISDSPVLSSLRKRNYFQSDTMR